MQEKFRLCENDLSSNFTAVRDWIHDTYSELAAANHPYSTDYIGKVPAYPVKVACSFLDKDFENDEDLLSGVFEAISVFRNFSGTTQCNNISGPGETNLMVRNRKRSSFHIAELNIGTYRFLIDRRLSRGPGLDNSRMHRHGVAFLRKRRRRHVLPLSVELHRTSGNL